VERITELARMYDRLQAQLTQTLHKWEELAEEIA